MKTLLSIIVSALLWIVSAAAVCALTALVLLALAGQAGEELRPDGTHVSLTALAAVATATAVTLMARRRVAGLD
ncbi:hypothetical protein ACSFCK_12335 [Brevibacterium luteolum]|uniref:hypothetical protein n=1 Tax=Brevibacterium luteolum TaxID=199591 RepID=UPI003EE93F42